MKRFEFAATVVLALVLPMTASAQLFEESFEVDPTANWVMHNGPVDQVGTGNTDGDNRAYFFFDYSSVGIPKAPNSATEDGTYGMKLQANLDANNDGISTTALVTGMSVSPVGLDLSSAGDFRLSFDYWGNYHGPLDSGFEGTSMLSTFGIGTSGTVANYPGVADGLWFSGTVDGGSASDFRGYSSERVVSYQLPFLNPEVDVDSQGQPIDSHATYHAGSRNSSAALYSDNFGGVAAPEEQLALYPGQTGVTPLGSLGFEWHEVEIEKIGNIVTWEVDDVLLMTVDITYITTPLGGGNILFGHSDINAGAPLNFNRFDLLFTLIDNIKVEAIESAGNGDFNGDGFVDAADYPVWRANDGTQAGYDAWVANFGTAVGGGSNGAGVVPEPGTLAAAVAGLLLLGAVRRRA